MSDVKEMRSDEINKSSAYILFYERDSLYQQRKVSAENVSHWIFPLIFS
ncbi:hypothetical protein FBUS_02535 [Fasciolopsis buskii]|uniref:Uncharacterized protein n=1 Tax=Fasciolopsis buskii TaxID=27845 RepID=A0A8E0RW28_9TREM|nr:hypothetical protein FBUS_02535 [Fasciolopsis buski]